MPKHTCMKNQTKLQSIVPPRQRRQNVGSNYYRLIFAVVLAQIFNLSIRGS